MRNIKIICFGADETLPVARVGRILCLSKVFAHAGFDVDLFFIPHSRVSVKPEREEEIDGSILRIVTLPLLAKGCLPIFFNKIINHIRTLHLISIRTSGVSAVFISGQNYRPYLLHRLQKWICSYRGLKLVEQLEESPFLGCNEKTRSVMLNKFEHRMGNSDIVLAISRWLYQLSINAKQGVQVIRMPILVDMDRFRIKSEPPFLNEEVTLAYCGNIAHVREIEILLKSFAIVFRRNKNLRLLVIGGAGSNTEKRLAEIQSFASKIGIEGKVIFTGPIVPSRIPKYLYSADIMLLPRPYADYSEAGFPSKLGEYLATGRPVVTTSTGDIPSYLTDDKNAYLVCQSGEKAFAERIMDVLSDIKKAVLIGANGKEVVVKSFSVEGVSRAIGSELVAAFEC